MQRLLALAAAFFLFAAACDSGTGNPLVSVSLEASSLATTPPLGVFTTDTGWSVVLTEAKLAIGSVYAFAPDPDAVTSFALLLGPSIARAHGGVDPLSGRVVRAQWLTPFVVDALATSAVALGPTSAESGTVDALEVRLSTPPSSIAAQTSGHQAFFAGTATKDGVAIDFAGGVDITDVGTEQRVEGIALADVLGDGGTLTLAVHAPTFFGGVFFDELPPEDPATGVRPIAAGSQPYEAIELGIRNPRSYSTSYAAAGATP